MSFSYRYRWLYVLLMVAVVGLYDWFYQILPFKQSVFALQTKQQVLAHELNQLEKNMSPKPKDIPQNSFQLVSDRLMEARVMQRLSMFVEKNKLTLRQLQIKKMPSSFHALRFELTFFGSIPDLLRFCQA